MSQPIENVLHIDPANLRAYSSGLLQGTAYNRMHTQLTRTLIPFGISVPEWKLLGQVYEHDNLKLNTLAELLSYDPPMVTKQAKSLEKKSLIKRTQDPKDERSKIIAITNEGKQLIEQIEPEVKKTMHQLLNGVSREELLAYIKVLTTIVNNSH